MNLLVLINALDELCINDHSAKRRLVRFIFVFLRLRFRSSRQLQELKDERDAAVTEATILRYALAFDHTAVIISSFHAFQLRSRPGPSDLLGSNITMTERLQAARAWAAHNAVGETRSFPQRGRGFSVQLP